MEEAEDTYLRALTGYEKTWVLITKIHLIWGII
jgi:hypothetical protein